MANGGRAGYMGRPKYFTIYYRSTRSLQENMRICQGNLREFSGTNCPTFIAMNQLAVKITRRSLSFGCICINSSTCIIYNAQWSPTVFPMCTILLFFCWIWTASIAGSEILLFWGQVGLWASVLCIWNIHMRNSNRQDQIEVIFRQFYSGPLNIRMNIYCT